MSEREEEARGRMDSPPEDLREGEVAPCPECGSHFVDPATGACRWCHYKPAPPSMEGALWRLGKVERAVSELAWVLAKYRQGDHTYLEDARGDNASREAKTSLRILREILESGGE